MTGKHIIVSGKYLLHTKCNPEELLKAKKLTFHIAADEESKYNIVIL